MNSRSASILESDRDAAVTQPNRRAQDLVLLLEWLGQSECGRGSARTTPITRLRPRSVLFLIEYSP